MKQAWGGFAGILLMAVGLVTYPEQGSRLFATFSLQLGTVIAVISSGLVVIERTELPPFGTAIASTVAATTSIWMMKLFVEHSGYPNLGWEMSPWSVGSMTWLLVGWGIGMASALGVSTSRKQQSVAIALCSVTLYPLANGIILTVNAVPGAVPLPTSTYLYPTLLVVGVGTLVALPTFAMSQSVRSTRPTHHSPSNTPIALFATVFGILQSVALLVGFSRHQPPLVNVGSGVVLVLILLPVLLLLLGSAHVVRPQMRAKFDVSR